jgi:hypothetical protein
LLLLLLLLLMLLLLRLILQRMRRLLCDRRHCETQGGQWPTIPLLMLLLMRMDHMPGDRRR